MFKTVFSKTLYAKRWGLMAWAVGLAALVVFTMIFFPTLSKSFSEALTNVPDSLKSFIGDSNAYKTVAGYTDVQIITQYSFMTLIYGIILFTGLLAGDENEGTLQTLLAQPVRRSRVYYHKLGAAMVALAAVCLSIGAGVLIGVAIIGEHVGLGRLTLAILALWLITMVFSAFSYMLGAISGKRGLAGGLAGAIAFTSLLITSLADSVKALKPADRFSPFHYFNKPGILQHGVHWPDLLVLVVVAGLMIVIGAIVFNRRDIYQR